MCLSLESLLSPRAVSPSLGSPLFFISGNSFSRVTITNIEEDVPGDGPAAGSEVEQCCNARLARKETAAWVSMEAKAVRLRALNEGVRVVDHDGKADALLGFLTKILAKPRRPVWRLDLHGLYDHTAAVEAPSLVAPFDRAEIMEAVDALYRTSSPGPDGLGPAFYQAAWCMVNGDLHRLFDKFHSGDARLDWINRAYITLLPKTSKVPTRADYRPVSLQNGDIKILCRG
ncbi:hypothetical protein D1007_21012 [Hordeum vulgare]|nr:hypothetical protein D1007_21012 [Hordeum vulgare]